MKKLIAAVLVVAVLLTSGLLVGCRGVAVTGSGNLTTETFNFSNFNKIEAASGFQQQTGNKRDSKDVDKRSGVAGTVHILVPPKQIVLC